MEKLKAIIFDLGGVILNIDYQATIEAFKGLGIKDFETVFTQHQQNQLFDLFETGKITESTFVTELGKHIPSASIEQLISAWNAMLLNLPKERWSFLEQLGNKIPIYLLSNTNETHLKGLEVQLPNTQALPLLKDLFENAYFSNEIGLRKPDVKTFEFVLSQNDLEASNTLFIDDTAQHIQGAKKAGLHTWHLTDGQTILDLDKALQERHLMI